MTVGSNVIRGEMKGLGGGGGEVVVVERRK